MYIHENKKQVQYATPQQDPSNQHARCYAPHLILTSTPWSVPAYNTSCTLPLATRSALHTAFPPAANLPSTLENTVLARPPSPRRAPRTTAQVPLDDESVKPPGEPATAAAVKVAQVPLVYHVPLLMTQPVERASAPATTTSRVARPAKGVPGATGLLRRGRSWGGT